MTDPSRFAGKAVLVTGAASGIGRAVALRFAREGADVLAFDIDADGLAATRADAEGAPGSIRVREGDVTRREECRAAVAACVEELGGIDVLANVAGIIRPARFDEMPEADYRLTMGVNADGPFFMAQAAIGPLLEREGNIVNVASTAAIEGQAYTVAYCMSKAAIALMTKAIAMEYVKTPLRVNAVLPGGTQTTLVDTIAFPDDVDFDLVLNYSGFRGMNTPDEVAAVVAFVASDEASAIHGAFLPVDRGALAD
jgi:meso-butanediol dehydrogenase/(S,S)-butanediol dehydrogenase/diacetyl reductase